NTATSTADAIRAVVAGPATGPPVSSPRAPSATFETGLISTNACSQPGSVSVGTKTLLPKVSGSMTSAPSPCTERGSRTTIASAVNTQHRPNAKTVTNPSAPSTPSTPPLAPNPS